MTIGPATSVIDADYLVIGAGAMGMAFADVLVAESNASVVIVDRRDQPGGHWNDAYPFVRLHSAAAHYGVNSTALGNDTIERGGLNEGFFESASAQQICAYYERIMHAQFLTSGRVRYFPMCDYRGGGRFVSLVSGIEHQVNVRKKIVDASYTQTEIPARRPPRFSVERGMRCIPPNGLPNVAGDANNFVVVGAGKTGIDACLWLLQHVVPSERIRWIMPRDSWLLDRRHVQPRQEFFAARMGAVALQTDLILQAQSVDHLLSLLNAHGQLLRIDETVTPKRYRCATVSQAELAELRRIKHIVRLGHVRRIDTDRIVLDRGSIPTDARTVHVDCTSSGIGARTSTPVFEGRTITLQSVRTCQQGFSAALIAHIELGHTSEAEKNRLCNPIPLPELDIDWLTMFVANLENQRQWTNNADLRGWIAKSRLDINFGQSREPTGEERELVQRFKDNAAPAVARLRLLLGSQDRDSGFEAAATRRGTTPHVASTAEHVG